MRKLNQDINIFVSCHKDSYVPENKYIIPIQAGADISSQKFEMIGDDTGDNISKLNKHFCELTTQYWAWKNVDCEYYGFCHYNKYFAFNPIDIFFYDCMSDNLLSRIGLDEEKMEKIIKENDIILPTQYNLNPNDGDTLYNQYENSLTTDIKDMDCLLNVIKEMYPEYSTIAQKVIYGSAGYFYNMTIMSKKYFNAYCEWLFPILFRLHEDKDYSNASSYGMMSPKFLSERLMPIFIEYLKKDDKNVKIKELPIAFFEKCENPYLQPKYKEKVGICFASDDIYAKHLGVALTSLVKNTSDSNNYDIVIFDNHISEHNKNLMKLVVKEYPNISLRFVGVSSYVNGLKLFVRDYCNVSTYLRFAIIDLLRNYDRVIYLDGDIIVNHDIADMYKIDLGENYVAAAKDVPMAAKSNIKDKAGKYWKDYLSNKIKLKNTTDYFCAGIMIFNVRVMKEIFTTEDLFNLAIKEKFMYQDQDVLNTLCQGKVHFLDLRWDLFAFEDIGDDELYIRHAPVEMYEEYLREKETPYIIHFGGQIQPMRVPSVMFSNLYWDMAKLSPFYEEMIYEMMKKRAPEFLCSYKKPNLKQG